MLPLIISETDRIWTLPHWLSGWSSGCPGTNPVSYFTTITFEVSPAYVGKKIYLFQSLDHQDCFVCLLRCSTTRIAPSPSSPVVSILNKTIRFLNINFFFYSNPEANIRQDLSFLFFYFRFLFYPASSKL